MCHNLSIRFFISTVLVFSVNNKFNKTTGGADVIDVSGGKRPSAILEIYDNQFLGGNDDGLDLDGMDAHIEGNDFSGFSSNNRVGFFSAAIATGKPALKFGVWLNMTVKGIDEIVESFRFRIDRKGEFYEPNLKKEIALPNNAIKNLSNHLVKEYQERFGKTVEVNLETDESNITVVRNFFYQNQKEIDGLVFFLGDQPDVKNEVIQSIQNKEVYDNKVLIPQYRYKLDFPVFVPRQLWPKLELLTQEDSVEVEPSVYKDFDLIDYFISSETKVEKLNFNFLSPTDYDEEKDF